MGKLVEDYLCFDFQSAERALSSSAAQIPNWSVSVRARKALCHTLFEAMSGTAPWSDDDASTLPPREARKAAAFNLGLIAVRAAGSAQCLISCGYVPEAKTAVRRLMETDLRCRAVADDETGKHAKAWLSGRPWGSAAQLRRRYGYSHPDTYSDTAHADVSGLRRLCFESSGKRFLDVMPHKDDELADALLGFIAATLLLIFGILTQIFIPTLSLSTTAEAIKVAADLGLNLTGVPSNLGGDVMGIKLTPTACL